MNIEIKKQDDIAIAVIVGEIDGKTAPQAQSELLPVITTNNKVIMDMRDLTYMSSAGLRMLLLIYRHAASKDCKIVLIGLLDEIKETMEMTGFLKFFVVADTLEQGLKELT